MGKKTDREKLENMYKIWRNGFDVVIEQLEEWITTNSQKIGRSAQIGRSEQFEENRQFKNNLKQFFRTLEQDIGGNVIPDANRTKEFWRGLWRNNVVHEKDVMWIETDLQGVKNKGKQTVDVKERVSKVLD